MGKSRLRSVTVTAFATTILACALIAAQGAIDARSDIRIPLSTTSFSFRANASPRAVPKRARAPVRLTIAGEVKDEGIPPALTELVFDLDRSFGFDLNSLSTCGSPRQVRAKCRSSIVAEGTVEFLLSFPENTPIPVESDLTLFKANTRDGVTTLYLHAYLPIPTPQAVVATVEVRKIREGRYGTRATISIPRIAEGYGAVTSFRLTIPKRTVVTGEPLSVANLRCADGRFEVRATSTFANGMKLTGTAARRCATVPDQ